MVDDFRQEDYFDDEEEEYVEEEFEDEQEDAVEQEGESAFLFDDFRDDASESPFLADFEEEADDSLDYADFEDEPPYRSMDRLFGMTPVQRLIIAVMLFGMVCILSAFCLLVTERIALPF